MGFPVVLKAIGPTLLHKTERRAVVLDLASEGDVREAASDLASRLGDEMTGYLVQRMVPAGVEMLVGAINDPLFGPVIVCGSGGVLAELLADSASRLHPLTDDGRRRNGRRAHGARDCYAGIVARRRLMSTHCRQVILRVSALLTICPESSRARPEPREGSHVRRLRRGCPGESGAGNEPAPHETGGLLKPRVVISGHRDGVLTPRLPSRRHSLREERDLHHAVTLTAEEVVRLRNRIRSKACVTSGVRSIRRFATRAMSRRIRSLPPGQSVVTIC